MYWLVAYSIVAVLILSGLSWLLWINRRFESRREVRIKCVLYPTVAIAWGPVLVIAIIVSIFDWAWDLWHDRRWW
jgi:hypothetical protein